MAARLRTAGGGDGRRACRCAPSPTRSPARSTRSPRRSTTSTSTGCWRRSPTSARPIGTTISGLAGDAVRDTHRPGVGRRRHGPQPGGHRARPAPRCPRRRHRATRRVHHAGRPGGDGDHRPVTEVRVVVDAFDLTQPTAAVVDSPAPRPRLVAAIDVSVLPADAVRAGRRRRRRARRHRRHRRGQRSARRRCSTRSIPDRRSTPPSTCSPTWPPSSPPSTPPN